jgi:hypothetical protein
MKMAVFWDAPYSLVLAHRRFRGAHCLHHHRPDGDSTSEMFVNFYQATQRKIQENSYLHILN